MFKIDIHTHILPKKLPRFIDKFGYGGFIRIEHQEDGCKTGTGTGTGTEACQKATMIHDNGSFFRQIESNCWDPDQRIAECREHAVDVQVLSTLPVMFCYWTRPKDGLEVSRFLNDHLASVTSLHPKRFVGLGTVPLQDPELAIQELHRCMKDLNMKGLQIGSNINGINLDDPVLHPFYAEAQKLGASLFVHPWDMMGKDSMPKYWLPWLVGMPAETCRAICSMIFGGIFEKFPQLKVAFAHGGGSFPGTIGRIEHGFQARPDLCAVSNQVSPRKSLGKFYVDSLVHDPQILRQLIQLVGEKRVALGSDYPFPLGEDRPGQMIEGMGDLSRETKEYLLSGTALDWLGMERSFFK